MQQPLARLPNLFSVITVMLLINMPLPFKVDSCKNFATNLNAASALGLGSKKCSKHFTLVSNIPIVFWLLFFGVNIKKEIYEEKKNMHKIGSIKTGKNIKHIGKF